MRLWFQKQDQMALTLLQKKISNSTETRGKRHAGAAERCFDSASYKLPAGRLADGKASRLVLKGLFKKPPKDGTRKKTVSYDGWLRNPFAPRKESMVESIVCRYLQGNHQKPGFLIGAGSRPSTVLTPNRPYWSLLAPIGMGGPLLGGP